jgi:hypothetical protein
MYVCDELIGLMVNGKKKAGCMQTLVMILKICMFITKTLFKHKYASNSDLVMSGLNPSLIFNVFLLIEACSDQPK